MKKHASDIHRLLMIITLLQSSRAGPAAGAAGSGAAGVGGAAGYFSDPSWRFASIYSWSLRDVGAVNPRMSHRPSAGAFF